MLADEYKAIRQKVSDAGFSDEIEWAQSIVAPETPEAFASEAIWVILNSGMAWRVARIIAERVWGAIREGRPISSAFGHKGKVSAIEYIWENRDILYQKFFAAEDVLEFCQSLPWIGPITKYHLAKNLGADVAKPDRHLVRIACKYNTDPHTLCATLSATTGDRIATVDLVLWRAAERRMI